MALCVVHELSCLATFKWADVYYYRRPRQDLQRKTHLLTYKRPNSPAISNASQFPELEERMKSLSGENGKNCEMKIPGRFKCQNSPAWHLNGKILEYFINVNWCRLVTGLLPVLWTEPSTTDPGWKKKRKKDHFGNEKLTPLEQWTHLTKRL